MVRKQQRTDHGRVCQRCGHENEPRARKCAKCEGKRFAPPFVKRLRPVTRNFFVQLTAPLSEAPNPPDRVTLYKWWQGGRTNVHINTSEQWEKIKQIIDVDLAPFLGWRTKQRVTSELAGLARDTKRAQKKVVALAQGNPSIITGILRGIDFAKIAPADHEKLGDALTELAAIYTNASEGMRKSIQAIVKKLPDEGEQAVRELSGLMESLTLGQITAVTGEVQRRMDLLRMFKERALDDRTYEIRGDGSIHRLLEQAMWIVDERYWLMHSNQALRTVVGQEMAKEDKTFEKKRPDFVCGTVDKKLIIIELKRPSHALTVDDLNQLERYIVIAQEYEEVSGFEALLVGKKIGTDLARVLKVRSRSFKAITFSHLVDATEHRYENYLKHLHKRDG